MFKKRKQGSEQREYPGKVHLSRGNGKIKGPEARACQDVPGVPRWPLWLEESRQGRDLGGEVRWP